MVRVKVRVKVKNKLRIKAILVLRFYPVTFNFVLPSSLLQRGVRFVWDEPLTGSSGIPFHGAKYRETKSTSKIFFRPFQRLWSDEKISPKLIFLT